MSKLYNVASLLRSEFSKKMFFVLLVIMGVFGSVNAQISVTATAATLGPTPYTSLKLAFDAINAGTHQGVVTISVTGNTTEPATAILNTSAAPSSYTAVHIKPTGVGPWTITGNLSPSIIKLNGADSVTIDGSLAVGGTSRDLTISNSSASNTTGVIWVASASGADGANNNVIKNCIITGSGTSQTLAVIAQCSGTTISAVAETANSNNVYNNNAVSAGQYGIGLAGPAGNEDANTIVSGNFIGSAVAASKILHAGILVAQQKNVLVTGNTISGVDGLTSGGLFFQSSGILVGGTVAGGGLIEKNKISNIHINNFWGCNGIQLESSTANTGLVISNNFIWDAAAGGYTVEFNTVDDNACGIAVNSGGGYTIEYNSIDMSTNQINGGFTAALWIGGVSPTLAAGALTAVKNNIFANRETTSSRYSVFCNSANTVFVGGGLNYNDLFSAQSVGFLSATQASLTNWQTATGQEANSVATDPFYTSTSDLHLLGNSPLDALATPIGGITRDIDGDVRNATTPDIGADEFTPPNCSNPVTNGFPATASTIDICASGSAILSASGYSYGIGIAYQWEVSTVGVGGPFGPLAGQTNPLSGSTGVINATRYYRLRVQCSGGAFGYSTVITITVNNPAVTPGPNVPRCGVGTVNLTATGTNLQWYSTSTGGAPIGSGSPFTTPLIYNTTNFYVSASSGGINCTGGKASSTGANGGVSFTDAGLIFDATQSFVIDSVKMYPQAAGTITVSALTSAGVTIATTNVTFAGAAPAGVFVSLGFTIPIGTNHRIIISGNSSSISIWRDFTGTTFPYPLCTAGSITNGYLSGPFAGFYYFFFDWHIHTGCESLRSPVTAIVNAPPVFTTFSPAAGAPRTICSGSSVTLNATGGGYTTYTWNPGALPNGSVVTPATTTTYTLTADIPGGCRRDSVITITVNSTPTALVVTPTGASVCPNTPTAIVATGGLISGQSIFTETAETFPFSQWAFTNANPGIGTLSQNTTYFQQGAGSIYITTFGNDFVDASLATSSVINLTGFTNPSLTFYQIAGLEATGSNHYDVGYVEYSIDGGASYTKFPASAYSGSGSIIGGFVGFDNTSYPDWDAQFTGGASTPGVAPATSLWKLETVDLTSWQGQPNFKIRFHLVTDVSIQYYGWLIDNIKITGTGQAPITWSPIANLYTNAAGTIPYVGGANAPNVWYNVPGPIAAVTYTATATAGVSCTATATTTLSASSLAASVSISANPSGAICSGTCVTFTATPVNGGAPPGYNWKVNGISVSGGSQVGLNVFTICNLVAGDLVTCAMSVNPNVGSCIVATVVTSNTISYVGLVNPTPTANNITGATGTDVCTGAPNLLTETAVGTITNYQWLFNGSPVGINSNTYTASAPAGIGTYNCIVTSNMGCKDTSNDFIVTQPTYIITATAGPNGTISPSGAVSVDCGDDITFTITPNFGYSILDVLVDGSSVGAVGTYTFTNVTATHTIDATFFNPGCGSPATSDAGPDVSICAGVNHTLAGSYGGAASSGTWSSSGTGTFNPNTTVGTATSYTPSAADIIAGSVILTVTTDDPTGPCTLSTSSMTLTIKPSPSVTITGQIGLCTAGATTTWLVADTSATTVNITTFAWVHGGPIGTNNDSLHVLAGQTGNYSVTVTGTNGCTATNAVVVNTFPSPTVTIAGTGPICTDATIDINATPAGGSGIFLGNTFEWYLTSAPGTPLGPNNSVLSASSAGTYFATVADDRGCVSGASNNVTLAMDNTALNGNYTIGAGPASCTNYLSFRQAILDLNRRSISANVRFSVAGGYTETAPAGGLILGTGVAPSPANGAAALNTQTASGLTITFVKSGPGANPKITATTTGTGTPATAVPDGIFKLRGVDNVSILQIDFAENPLNTTLNTRMEYAIGLFRYTVTDGAQNNIIQGCNITLDKANDVGAGGLMSEGSTGIIVIGAVDSNAIVATTPTSAAGTNSNNKFYGNTITNCHNGFWLSGNAAASPFTLGDNGNDIGGSSAVTGNTITNFGNTGDATAPQAVKINNQWGLNVSYNTIDNNNGAGVNTTNTLRGIYGFASSISANATFNSNTISLKSGSTGGAVVGIENAMGSTAAGNTITITNNTISGSNTVATTATWTGILNSATASNVTISGNTVQGVSLTGTGTFNGIQNTALVPTLLNLNNNNILNNSKSSTGTMNGITYGVAQNTSIVTNVISGNTITGGAAPCTLNCIIGAGAAGVAYTLDGNTLYNNGITGMTLANIGTVYGFFNNSGPNNEVLTDNIVRKLYVTGAAGSTALHVIRGLFTNTVAASVRSCLRNKIDSLYSNSAASAAITGIWSQVGGTVTIANNKIHSLFPGQSATAGAIAKGINIQAGSTIVKISNNMISLDLSQAFAPAANNVLTGANAVSGIEITANSIPNVMYYNTIRLAGGGSGTAFGSSGISLVANTAGQSDTMKNNIVVNLMTPGGGATGFTTALRRTTTTFGNYPSPSNNNLWYTTETATTPLYYNGTATYVTLAAMIGNVTPRDTLSIDDLPVFVNTALNDLHLATGSNCGIDGAGQPIAAYQDDYDVINIRDPFAPDMGCDEFDGTGGGTGIWRGYNTDWLDPKNWCGAIPTAATNVVIPKRFSGKYPIIPNGVITPVANNITINQYASITINTGGQLSNKGAWLNNGTLTNNGTIELNGTATQLFPNVAGSGNLAAMTNLTANNTVGVTIDKDMTLTGILRPKVGNLNINNVVFTLHSDASGTASVDTVLGAITYTGAGKFSIERYISSITKTGWRFLGVPLQDTCTQTINKAWQEGDPAGVYATQNGYGMQIVGPSSAGPGFDLNNTIPSLKVYTPATNTWVSTAGTLIPIATKEGYMTFIRGDRSKTIFGAMGPTALRSAGQIRTGAVTVSTANANINQYMSVANPYPCAISFAAPATVKTGLTDVYYLWDPQRNTYGAYVTFAGPTYTASTLGGSYNGNNAIESGEAMFLYTNGTVGTHSIAFSENSKSLSNFQVARAAGTEMQFSTRLFLVSGTELKLYDGNRVDFDNAYSNSVDEHDAFKLTNFGENFGLLRDGKIISVERRAEVVENDTIFFDLGQFRQLEYQLEFNPLNMATPGLTAYLEDAYLHTSTVVDLAAVSTVNFTVNADAASKAADRFRIVFHQLGPVPLSFTSVTAHRQDKNIMVNWKVDNELNIASYDVEGSADGINFRKLGAQPATGNGNGITLQYNWLDEHPFTGNNFYRIRSVGNSGAVKYSQVVKVNMAGDVPMITAYPNPVKEDGIIRISMTNQAKGLYTINVLNAKGQVVLTHSINHEGGNSVYELELKGSIAHGNYLMQVAEGNKVKTTIKIVY